MIGIQAIQIGQDLTLDERRIWRPSDQIDEAKENIYSERFMELEHINIVQC